MAGFCYLFKQLISFYHVYYMSHHRLRQYGVATRKLACFRRAAVRRQALARCPIGGILGGILFFGNARLLLGWPRRACASC